MKMEKAFKIQTDIMLLKGGYYDKEVYEYISNKGLKQWLKDFNIDYVGQKSPGIEANRMWWFKTKLYPELFKKRRQNEK